MYAVVNRKTDRVLLTCSTKEGALVAAQVEKDKLPLPERGSITAVAMDDEGYTDIRF